MASINENIAAAHRAALEGLTHWFNAFNAAAPCVMQQEWDVSWETFSADDLYDLRDEFEAMHAAIIA